MFSAVFLQEHFSLLASTQPHEMFPQEHFCTFCETDFSLGAYEEMFLQEHKT